MYYSNNSKINFERPIIPPILKVPQHHQNHHNHHQHPHYVNSKSNNLRPSALASSTSNTPNSLVNSNHNNQKSRISTISIKITETEGPSVSNLNTKKLPHRVNSKRFIPDPQFLQQHLVNKQITNSNLLIPNSSSINELLNPSNKLVQTPVSSLTNAFPNFYLNSSETNYAKLIDSILINKLANKQKHHISEEISHLAPYDLITSTSVSGNESMKSASSSHVATNSEQSKNSMRNRIGDISYRLNQSRMQQQSQTNRFNANELQKRDQLSAKLSQSNQNPLYLSNGTDSSFSSRRSATYESSTSNNNANNPPPPPPITFRIQNSLAKNIIDLNNLQSSTTSNNQLFQLNGMPNRANGVSNNGRPSTSHFPNVKHSHDSGSKFIDEVASINQNNKRNLLFIKQTQSQQQTGVNTNQLPLSNQNRLVINRTDEEKALYPDKLVLEKRNLTMCPLIEGEDTLKLINYEHNLIKQISNFEQMRQLIFLDLYDNQIERISGLSTLLNLRVLMLGKNRIERIENLDCLINLDILDLHANQIKHVENLNSLHELRVLNLAANLIRVVDNLNGLHSLVELNLRRNQIVEINELEYCAKLQRLFLSFNEIDNVLCIKSAHLLNCLQELTLDNNPISIQKNYKRNVLAQFMSLKKLDTRRVTDEEKRIAEKNFQKEEMKKREMENMASVEEKRQMTIKNAENEWQMHQQRSNYLSNQKHKQEASMTKFYLNDELNSTSTLADTDKTNYYDDVVLDHNNENLNSVNASIDLNQTADSSLNNIIETLNAIEKSNQHGEMPNSLTDRNSSKNLIYQSFLTNNNSNNNQINAEEQTTSNKINTRLKIVALRSTPTHNVMRAPLSDRNNPANSASSSSSSIQSNTNEPNENDNHKARETSLSCLAQSTQNNKNTKPFYNNNNNSEEQDLLSSSSINNLRPITQISNSRPSSAASYQRQPLINIKSNTSLLATNTNAQSNLNSLIANTINPSSQAIKRSMAYNNGANIHEETCMFFYGNRSLDIIDMRLDSSVLNQVYTLSFHYIDYDLFLTRNFARIRNKFFNVNSLIFTCCNVKRLNQLDSLIEWKRLDSLTINNEDNPICSVSVWRSYAINRLSCLNIKRINNVQISSEELSMARKMFMPLSGLVLNLPEYKLMSILGADKQKLIKQVKEHLATSSNEKSNHATSEQLNSRDTIVRSVLNFNQNQLLKRQTNNADTSLLVTTSTNESKNLIENILKQTNHNDLKKQKLHQVKSQLWSQFVDMCHKAKSDPETHVNNLCKQHKLFL